MMKKSFIVPMIAGLALIFSLGTANAAFTTFATNSSVLVDADSAALTTVPASADIIYTTVSGEALAANDTITVTLTGGAVFTANSITMTPSAGDLGSGAGVATSPLSGGAAGDTTATWRVTATMAAGTTLTLNTNTANIFNVDGVALAGNVDLQIDMATSTGLVIKSTRSHYTDATKVYLFTGTVSGTVTNTAASSIAIVAATGGIYTKFTSNAVVTAASVLTVSNSSSGTTLPASTTFDAGKVLFTLTGDFTGVTSVSATGCTGSDSAGSTTGGTAGFFLINAAKTAAYAVNAGVVAAAGNIALAPVLTIDGTTAQDARVFTATVDVLAQSGDWTAHTLQSAATHITITRDGAQLIAPHMISRDGWETYLVFKTDDDASASEITVVMLNAAGDTATITSTELAALSLAAGSAGGKATVSASDLLGAAGWATEDSTQDFSATITLTLQQTEIFVDGFKYGDGATYPTAVYESKDFTATQFVK